MSATLLDSATRFAALGDPIRLGLITTLGDEGPSTATRLAADRPVTRQAVEKHLAVLDRAGLVRSERRGRERLWSVDARGLGDLADMLQRASDRWDAALQRLRAYVEA